MKKITLVLYLNIFISIYCSADMLEIAIIEFPPYEFTIDGEPAGISVVIVREIFKRMNQPINIVSLPWARALKYLETGEIDGLFEVLYKPERDAFADFSKIVLMDESASIFARKDSNITYSGDLESISSYTLGIVRGFSYGAAFDHAVENGTLTNISNANSTEINVLNLLDGYIDLIAGDSFGVRQIVKDMDRLSEIEELVVIEKTPAFMTFSKKKKLTAIRDEFDKILINMKKDGSYDSLIDNYF